MSKAKCTVNEKWLEDEDSNGRLIKEWCKIKIDEKNEKSAFCIVCHSILACSSKGKQALLQHALTVKHKDNVKIKLNERQLQLRGQSVASGTSGISNSNILQVFNVQDSVIKAELLWALKVVLHNMSGTSCDNIGQLFDCMFNCDISKKFSMARTKFGYYVTEALGPHFREQMLDDIANEYFTICYDETTNNESKKEMQIKLRYFSECEGRIVENHLESFFIGHATAEILVKCINSSMDNASLLREKTLMLGADGPNVNKKAFALYNELVKSRGKSLIDIGK